MSNTLEYQHYTIHPPFASCVKCVLGTTQWQTSRCHECYRECSRVVLGIEFHHLSNDDPFKVALKETIVAARQQLASYTICHVFHILDWLLVNQWSHPTLVAMMRGEDVDRDCGMYTCNV